VAIELTARQRRAIALAFAPFADRVDAVAVYGSRATGSSRPGSDVDLVFHGDAPSARIRAALDESALSVFADVVRYDEVRNARLLAEIDRDAIPLYTRADLTAFASEEASR
jgi:uncharacterized protein